MLGGRTGEHHVNLLDSTRAGGETTNVMLEYIKGCVH